MSAILISLVWTTGAVIGMLVCLWALRDVWKFLDLLKTANLDGNRSSMVFTMKCNIALCIALAAGLGLDAVAGVAAFFLRTPDPPPTNPVTPFAVLVTFAILVAELTFIGIAIGVAWYWRHLRAIVRAELAEKERSPQ